MLLGDELWALGSALGSGFWALGSACNLVWLAEGGWLAGLLGLCAVRVVVLDFGPAASIHHLIKMTILLLLLLLKCNIVTVNIDQCCSN